MGIALRRQKNVGHPALARSSALADLQGLIDPGIAQLPPAVAWQGVLFKETALPRDVAVVGTSERPARMACSGGGYSSF
jgi:hypothetical protein